MAYKTLPEKILLQACAAFQIEPSKVESIHGSVNFVYRTTANSLPCILRISDPELRNEEAICAELNFVHYLSQHGVSIASMIPIEGNHLYVPLADGYIATLFQRALGNHLKESDWTPIVYEEWGALLGKLHWLSKNYKPNTEDQPFIRHWYQDDWYQFEQYIPKSQSLVLQKAKKVLAEVKDLPLDREDYQIIHSDLHHRNFCWDGSNITAFDFDDFCYGWLPFDIAVIIYQSAYRRKKIWKSQDEMSQFIETFLSHFLQGYQTEHIWKSKWNQYLPLLLKLRLLSIYTFYHKVVKDPTDEQRQILQQIRIQIESDDPIIPFDFSTLRKGNNK